MPDETELRRDADRAARAAVLLADVLLDEAFVELRAAYLRKWELTAYADMVTREKIWLAISVMPLVRAHLETVVSSGSIAAKQLSNLDAERAVGRPRRVA